jgi:hypothetical protein
MTDDDATAAWIASTAAAFSSTLADPAVRAELLELLGGTDPNRRARRLDAARAELAGLEVHWRIGEENHGP